MIEVLLQVCIAARVPVLLWGPPGAGKSSLVRSVGEAMGLPVETIIASIREPADFAGLPVLREDGVRLEPPAWARRLAQAGKGLLFLDELSTAPPAVQAALLRVVLERTVGELTLPEGVAIIAAANPPEETGLAWELSPPLANRFLHLEWGGLGAQSWSEALLSGFNPPEVLRFREGGKELEESKALVAAFIRQHPRLLRAMPKEGGAQSKAWPSQRSWAMAVEVLAAARRAGLEEEAEMLLLSGAVGPGTALEFIAWKRHMDFPDPELVLWEPERFPQEAREDQAYALLSSVVSIAQWNEERWKAAWRVLAQAAAVGHRDVAAQSARILAKARQRAWRVPAEVRVFQPLLQEAGLL
jgi:hypothetical protein